MHEAVAIAQQKVDEIARNLEEVRKQERRAQVIALAREIYIHQNCDPHVAFQRAYAFFKHAEK